VSASAIMWFSSLVAYGSGVIRFENSEGGEMGSIFRFWLPF